MKNYFNISIIVLSGLFIQGCSIMPYQEESTCKFNGLGKCLSIDKAYKEALTGIDQGGRQVNGESTEIVSSLFWNIDKPVDTVKIQSSQANEDTYQSVIYQKMQQLVSQKEMPILAPAVVRRVLILPYRSKDSKTWYETRHVYYIEELPHWTLDKFTLNQQSLDSLNLFK